MPGAVGGGIAPGGAMPTGAAMATGAAIAEAPAAEPPLMKLVLAMLKALTKPSASTRKGI